jgi:hypothetical protein
MLVQCIQRLPEKRRRMFHMWDGIDRASGSSRRNTSSRRYNCSCCNSIKYLFSVDEILNNYLNLKNTLAKTTQRGATTVKIT